MFAVNYNDGGENDPIISYTDEKIGRNGVYTIGRGLLKRFFWQRLAMMNDGRILTTNIMLTQNDIANWYHRERIVMNGEKFELINIKGYSPLKNDTTQCILRKWTPISQWESLHTYPSENSILTDAVVVLVAPTTGTDSTEIDKVFDTQYNRLICLYTDIPRT